MTLAKYLLSKGALAALLAAVLVAAGCAADGEPRLKPFVSDGCTLFPDGDWRSCCVAHDRAYHRGGTADARRRADAALAACVARQGHPLIAKLIYGAVRVAGVPWLPTPWRWGFGYDWPHRIGYAPAGQPPSK